MSTKIEWTDATWNPVTGCTKVSQGCKNCYAERLAPKVFAGQLVEVNTTPPKHPEMKASAFRPRHFTDVLCHPERLDAPLHWKKPRRIFVNSMSDLFHEDVADEFITKVWTTMANAPQHEFQILTKRPQRMLDYLLASLSIGTYIARPLPNVWLGVSVEDQATADERIPLLLQTPAAVRFLSCEPLIGPINISRWLREFRKLDSNSSWFTPVPGSYEVQLLNWVIAGGESGPHARPSHPDWFRSLRDQCAAAGVPFFFKQWGEWVSVSEVAGKGPHRYFEDGATVRRIGKKAAGRTLDGRIHDEYPDLPLLSQERAGER